MLAGLQSEVTVLVLLIAALAAPGHAATHAPGAVIENAVTLDVTEPGFEAITAALPALIPENLPVDDTSSEGGYWCFNYAFALSNLWVGFEVSDVTITPMDGYLDITAELLVNVNDATDPFSLYTELACIGDTCDGYVEPFPVTIHTTMAMDVVTGSDGNPTLDATIGDIELSYELDTTEDINLDDCAIGTIQEILEFFGLDMYDWIIGLVEPTLTSTLDSLGPELETTIEDAFGQAMIEQDVDLLGTVLHVELYPGDVVIDPGGMRVALNGAMSTDTAADCIAVYDPGGSLATESDPPTIGEVPSGISADPHAIVSASDDLVNQALYAVWRGGVLCYTVTSADGLPLDTSTILGVLAGDAFDELFPEAAPMQIGTSPAAPPTAVFDGDHDVGVAIEDLGLDLYAELDHRQARVLGLSLGTTAGVDLGLDSSTGALDIALDLGLEEANCTVSANELVPDSTSDIESKCASTLSSVVGGMVGSLLEIPEVTLPAFGALGLTGLETSAAGSAGDWLGVFAWIGEVSYGSSSSSCSSGCAGGDTGGGSDTGSGASSCSGTSCTTGGGLMSRWFLLGTPLAVLILRRRRA